jgi:hypothetical protein
MKKIILLTVIGIYFTFALSSPIILAEDNGGSGFFTPVIEFEDIPEFEEPIPLSASQEIEFKVKFKLNLSSLAKQIFFNRRIGRAVMFGFSYFFKFNELPKANLSLSFEKPDWCDVELDKEKVEFEYNNEFEEAEVKGTITLNETAPALEKDDIIITASYPGLGRVEANSKDMIISIMPKYESNIDVEAKIYHHIPPLKETKIPINITNNGNGQSRVRIDISDLNKWNITLDQEEITVDIGETKQVKLSVTPPEGFKNNTIPLTFIPVSTVEDVDELFLEDDNVVFDIVLIYDHSLDNDELDFTMILTIALIIIIVIVLLAIIFKKRKKN